MAGDDVTQLFGAHRLTRRQRLVAVFLVALTAFVLLLSLGYNLGMQRFAGVEQSFVESVRIVVEALTTTGFGSDSNDWGRVMEVYMIFVMVSGTLIGFFTLRVLVIPLWTNTPVELDDRLTPKSDHVVVCEYERDSGVLLDELERLGIEYVLIESDGDEAKRLSDAGYQAIDGDPERVGDLQRASIEAASLVITDAGAANTSIMLTARELNEDVRVVCLTESRREAAALQQIGADRVISPHAIVGERLAHMAAKPVVPHGAFGGRGGSERGGSGEDSDEDENDGLGLPLGDDVVMTELLIRRSSPLRGVRLGASEFARRSDLEVVAGWIDGQPTLSPGSDELLTGNTVLVVVGSRDAVADVLDDVSGVRSPRRHSNVIVAGMGEGGKAAVGALPERVSPTTVDAAAGEGVDVVGDVRDPETLERAGIDDATALIVSVDDDATALFAVALARTMTDDVEILARVSDTDKVRNAYTAGADYVLSVQRVVARLLAGEVYGEDVMLAVGQIRTVRVDGDAFAGQSLADAEDGDDAEVRFVGCVLADGTFTADRSREIEDTDSIVVVGTDDAIQAFEEEHA